MHNWGIVSCFKQNSINLVEIVCRKSFPHCRQVRQSIHCLIKARLAQCPSKQVGVPFVMLSPSKMACDLLDHKLGATAGPSSPTLSLPGAPADSGRYGAASAQQAASSLPASSIPGSTGSQHMSYGALAPPLSGSRRPHRSDLSQGYTPQRGRRLSMPGNSGFSVSFCTPELKRLISAPLTKHILTGSKLGSNVRGWRRWAEQHVCVGHQSGHLRYTEQN